MDVATHDPTQRTEAERAWAIAKFQEWEDEDERTRRLRHYGVLVYEARILSR